MKLTTDQYILGYEEWVKKYIGDGPEETVKLLANAIAIWEKYRIGDIDESERV
jgi:hypothetical protein